MKNQVLFFLYLLLGISVAMAQCDNTLPSRNRSNNTPCDVVVTGDFDSECIYDDKNIVTDEYPNYLVACKNSQVTYTSHANVGTGTVAAYRWEVTGDVSHTDYGNHTTVNWGNGDYGTLVATVVNSYGDSCFVAYRVRLIDIPTASATSVPAYIMDNGVKVIEVCYGGSVQFYDNSDAGNSDIAGYYWSNGTVTAATPNFLVENITTGMTITHRVYNNCSCYDEEEYRIKVQNGDNLVLECYGTVCKDSVVTYHATYPTCSDYYWYVEGGILLGGQFTASPTVQWNNPSNGYGVIGLDGTACSSGACPMLMTRSVPVIHDGLAIDGQSELCVGEAVMYRLPLFGSTRYDWTITPTTGVSIVNESHANEVLVIFSQAGNYTLSADYRCDFLDCGPMDAEPLTITVKPRLEIVGHDRICISNPLTLGLSPSVTAEWTITDLATGDPVTYTTGTALTHNFLHPGRYLVTASNSNYCEGAAKVVDVQPTPPAPTVCDLDTANRHTACLGQGILLAGTPAEPYYSLVWSPVCNTASPQLYSGDSVTISYPTEVCDVRVYNYDRVLQCMSADYYLHTVDQLSLAPVNFTPRVVCPNTTLTITELDVPNQRREGVLYEWKIQDTKQHCASIQGSHMRNTANILCNNLASLPETFYVTLKRTYCNGISHFDTLWITTRNSANQLSISGPDTVCLHETATFTGSGSPNLYWSIEGTPYSGSTATHTFDHTGNRPVVLRSTDDSICSDRTKNVYVKPLPAVQGLVRNVGIISLNPYMNPSDYTFQWWYYPTGGGTPVNLGTNATAQYSLPGTYCCTVTDRVTECSYTVCNDYGDGTGCIEMTLLHSNYNYCNNTIQITSPLSINNVLWQVEGGGAILQTSGTNNSVATVTVSELGYVTVTATTTNENNQCVVGTYYFLVDFIPEFEFVTNCSSVQIINHSQYLDGTQTVYIHTPGLLLNSIDIISFPASQSSATYIPHFFNSRTYTFWLTGYGSDYNIDSCILGTCYVPRNTFYFGNPVPITTSNIYNNDQTCNNTPIRLTASLYNNRQIKSVEWTFSDGSSATSEGDTIWHTFTSSTIGHNVVAYVTDIYNCTYTSNAFAITSNTDNLVSGLLTALGNASCPYVTSRNISFGPNANNNHYTWSNAPVNGPSPHPTYHTGDYFVYVMDEYYCQKESSAYVAFLNAPTAFIYAEKYALCLGDTLKLYGEQGPGTNPMGYAWSTSTGGSFSPNTTTANPSFGASDPGSYTVSLTVTDNTTHCSSTATENITVVPRPTAPTLYFPSSQCGTPVSVGASGFASPIEVHWSNGETTNPTNFYTHGLVTAYTFDPQIGCSSEHSQLRLPKRPDFDALLTGCYKRCQEFFPDSLPVYGLTDDNQTIGWSWYRNNTSIASGSGNYFDPNLWLPLPNFGDYNLDVTYAPSCSPSSPTLRITEAEKCLCDSISITYTRKTHNSDPCEPQFDYFVTICNHSANRNLCLDSLISLFNSSAHYVMIGTNFTPTTITPGNCYSFQLRLVIFDLVPSLATFEVVDSHCQYCRKQFTLDLMPDINCEVTDYYADVYVNSTLTNNHTAYYDIHLYAPDIMGVLAMWSEPPMIVNYSASGSTVVGLGMIDLAVMSQLIPPNSPICVYAIVCTKKNGLCKLTFCRPARWWYERLLRRGVIEVPEGYVFEYPDEESDNTETPMYARPNSSSMANPQLSPNPTTDEVTVVGDDGKPLKHKISELQIMDMTGRLMVTYSDTHCFNVAKLPSGSYIVRITATDSDGNSEIHYRKLVKK